METMIAPELAAVSSVRYTPFFVCRVAGAPMGEMRRMRSAELEERTEKLWHDRRRVQTLATRVADLLSAEVPRAPDKRFRNALLEIRRNVFNSRLPNAKAVGAVAPTLERDTQRALEQVINDFADLDRQRQDILAIHKEAIAASRAQLLDIIEDTDFRRGLVLSSESLALNVPRYQGRDEMTLGQSKRDQIERGLLRYLTRMTAKATPFGSFCSVVGGRIAEAGSGRQAPLVFDQSPRTKRPALRLNKRIYGHLWERMQRNAEVRRRLVAQVNPSLVREGDRLAFLTGAGGLETFNRIPQNDAVDVLLETIQRTPGATYGQLMASLASDLRLDASDAEASAFLDQVIELGLIRLKPVIADQEAEWHEPLIDFVSTLESPEVKPVQALLAELKGLLLAFEEADPDGRMTIVQRMRQRIRDGEGILSGIPWGAHEIPLYEDCGSDATLVLNMTVPVATTLEKLGEWIRLTLPLAGARREMATMRHFFDKRYNASLREEISVPLLTFYETFYREHFKAYLENVRTAKPGSPEEGVNRNPFKLPSVARAHNANFRLSELVRHAWLNDQSAGEIHLTREMVQQAIGDANDQDYVSARSASVFGGIAQSERGCRFVVHGGQYYSGFGKYFSRFLYLLPPEWESETVRENAAYEDGILAEVVSDASFNANLHPPLLPAEIAYPTTAGSDSSAGVRMLCSDLVVERDQANRTALVLRHRETGRRVIPMDMGFMNPTMRPPLFQLLSRFSPGGYFVFPIPSELDRNAAGPQDQLVRRPRIVYEKSVVLSREAWFAPDGAVPVWKAGESAADLFLRVNEWRLHNGIPTRVYVRVWPRSGPAETAGKGPPQQVARNGFGVEANAEGEQAENVDGYVKDDAATATREKDAHPVARNARASRDFHKPQFIDFANPLLVEMFARISGNLSKFVVVLEESLPEEKELAQYEGEAFHTELVCQIRFDKPTAR